MRAGLLVKLPGRALHSSTCPWVHRSRGQKSDQSQPEKLTWAGLVEPDEAEELPGLHLLPGWGSGSRVSSQRCSPEPLQDEGLRQSRELGDCF